MATPMSSLDSTVSGGLIPPLTLAGTSTPLANQVAGHQNVRADASGSLVIKPSLPKEIALYQMVNAAPRSSKLAKLKRFIPQFFGTLRLEGRMDDAGQLQQDVAAYVPESVVLQNLSYAFAKPNIMDAKLGTVLHEPGATAEKKAKMEKQARETTIGSTGLRLTGCQTWHAPSSTFMLTPKAFGKTITAEEMPSGMVRFFPSLKDSIPSLVLPPTPPSSTTNSETPIATSTAATATLLSDTVETDSSALPIATYSNHTIPPKTMLRVLALVDKQLSDLESVLSILEMRFVGASVLIVYEGDLARLEDALENWETKIHQEDALKVEPEPDSDEEDEMYESESEESDGSGDPDGAKEDAKMAKKCPPVVVKMIDFAHTWIAEGQGVDEGVLKGLRTLRGLVQGRSKELEALVM